MMDAGSISQRSITLSTYALCGFANFSSIAIQLGGIGGIAPGRRADLANLGLRALLGGMMAGLMTASIAGMFI
jgi:CNT family concentrative nucleoside transporter